MNENENATPYTPWSWQKPPLPRNLLLLGSDETRHSDTWFRPIWGCEKVFSLGAVSGAPGLGDIILSCQLSVPVGDNYCRLDLHAMKCAVKALRFEHPTIASQCAWPDPDATTGEPPLAGLRDGHLAYQVPKGELEVEEWLSRVVIDREADLHTCNNDLNQAISQVRRHLGKAVADPRAVDAFQVHFIPSSGAEQKHGIVLLLGHLFFDSIAAFQVMNLLLSKIAEIIDINSGMAAKAFAWGEEVKRLAKPFPDRSAIPWSAEKRVEDLSVSERFQDPRAVSKTAHGLHIPNPTASPSATGVIFKTVSSTRLPRLIRSMRKQACTMYGVLLATSLITMLRVNPPKAADCKDITTPISPCPLNLRTNCLRKNEDAKDKWEIISALAITVLFAEDLGRFVHSDSSDKLRLLNDIFTLAKELKTQLDGLRLCMPRASVWLNDSIDTFLPLPPPTVAIPMISSFGVMDVNLPPTYPIPNKSDAVRISNLLFSVRNPYPPSWLSIVVHAYTWQDVFYLTFSYPEAYMGSLQNLQAREHGPGESEGSVVDYVEEFMKTLDIIMDANDETGDSSGPPLNVDVCRVGVSKRPRVSRRQVSYASS